MKKTYLFCLFSICVLFLNAQINVNNFLGTYNCTLVQWQGTLYINYNRIISVLPDTDSIHFIGDDNGTTSFQSAVFFLNNDSTFFHVLNPTVRYGHFYKNDSIYVRMNSTFGYYDEYYGKKTNSSISEINKAQVIQVYPNPANSTITLELNNNCLNNNSHTAIKNILGKPIMTFKVNGSHQQMDVSTLPCGIYFIEVNTKYGILSKKLIINR